MFLGKLIAMTALATFTLAPAELPDLGRWNEVALPGAPFRVDIPMPLQSEGPKDSAGSKLTTWKTAYGLMNIEISFRDRAAPTSFSPRQNLEMLAGGLVAKWTNPSVKVTDLTVVGYPAARVEMEHDVTSGRIRTERLLIRVAEDDWVVQTTRFVGKDGGADSMHIFRSIKAPAPAPVLAPASVGRMTIKAFGKPVVTADKLEGDAGKTYEKWVTHAFDYQGSTKAWIYNIRVKPGQAFDAEAMARMLVDNVVQQSNPKPQVYPFPQTIGGLQGVMARGQAITGDGEECFRILAVGDGQEGWAMLIAGPNTARSEAMFREMIESIQIRR
jgi:hypothetical protein